MGMMELVEKATKEIQRITGHDVSTVMGVAKEEKGWKISMELVEKRSIPDQMDILALYEVWLGAEGNLLEFKCKSLRKRIDTGIMEY